nr:tripartite tricarboxylate transporter substrate-binding protein [Burkholderiaceae bacterium]
MNMKNAGFRTAGSGWSRRRVLKSGAVVAAGAALTMPLHAAAYPDRLIRFVVPFPAGGTGDVFVRTVGQHLSEAFGQSVIVENRPGASTIIGTQQVVRAP